MINKDIILDILESHIDRCIDEIDGSFSQRPIHITPKIHCYVSIDKKMVFRYRDVANHLGIQYPLEYDIIDERTIVEILWNHPKREKKVLNREKARQSMIDAIMILHNKAKDKYISTPW